MSDAGTASVLNAHFVFLSLLLIAASTPSLGRPVRIGYIAYPPIVVNGSHGPTGHLIDYVRRVLQEADLEPRYRETSVDRGLFQMQQGQLDIFLGLIKNTERERIVRFSQVPLFEAQSAVCGRTGRIQFPMRKPLRIAHFLATLLPPSLKTHQLIAVTPDDVTRRMLVMLQKQRADALFYVNPEILALYQSEMRLDFELDCYVFSDISLQVYMAFSRTVSPETEARINAALIRAKVQGDFVRYLQDLLKKMDRRQLKVTTVDSRSFILEEPSQRP